MTGTRIRTWLMAVIGCLGVAWALAPGPAQAWWRGGYGYGGFYGFPPIIVAPPVYYPPPVVYAPPPPVYVAPPAYSPAPAYAGAPGQSCSAGTLFCPMQVSKPVGASCYCTAGNGARAYGIVQ